MVFTHMYCFLSMRFLCIVSKRCTKKYVLKPFNVLIVFIVFTRCCSYCYYFRPPVCDSGATRGCLGNRRNAEQDIYFQGMIKSCRKAMHELRSNTMFETFVSHTMSVLSLYVLSERLQ